MIHAQAPKARRRLGATLRIILMGLSALTLFPSVTQAAFSPKDKVLLLRVQKDSARYFTELSHPTSGLIRDSSRPGAPVSLSATGFAMAVYAIAAERGWISRAQAYGKVKKILSFALERMSHKRGFFYHFVEPQNGRRAWGSEISSIDTALFIAGALFASRVFTGSEVRNMTRRLYERIDWAWMTNGTDRFSHGWVPEKGFLPYYWDTYSEQLLLQALAHGSPTHAPPLRVWKSWERLEDTYEKQRVVYSHTGSLFTYQFPHAYIDFRNLKDKNINYFDNSVSASLANQKFCIRHQDKYKSYGPNSWGLTAGLGPFGYRAYGASPGLALHDGTIAPYGAIASLPFTPMRSLNALKNYRKKFGPRLYGKYGFKDGFNVDQDWVADEWLGIDQGITVLMIENALDQTVWKNFMALDLIKRWIERCGL